MEDLNLKVGNDFERFSKGEFDKIKNEKLEYIIIDGKKLEVFTTINENGKKYVITRQYNELKQSQFDIYVQNGNIYIKPPKGSDKVYDHYVKLLDSEVYTDVVGKEEKKKKKIFENER